MNETLCLQELEQLYARLLPEERDELLQCLLIAAPCGEEAVIDVLEKTLLCHAAEELWDEDPDGGAVGSGSRSQSDREGV